MKDFFQGGGNCGFLQVVAKSIFQAGEQQLIFYFTNSTLRENILKFQNPEGPRTPCTPFG